ncbi:hypothetical protein KR018_006301 [Drosophila ironensis]|nr:hypothetical protein KR018_006301 [Drosophila ironensis]
MTPILILLVCFLAGGARAMADDDKCFANDTTPDDFCRLDEADVYNSMMEKCPVKKFSESSRSKQVKLDEDNSAGRLQRWFEKHEFSSDLWKQLIRLGANLKLNENAQMAIANYTGKIGWALQSPIMEAPVMVLMEDGTPLRQRRFANETS